MTRFQLQRTICVLILSAFVFGVLGSSTDVALSADDYPQSLEQLLNDPLFAIDADAPPRDVVSAANTLAVQIRNLNSNLFYTRVSGLNPQERQKEIEKLNVEQKENEVKFYKKFDEIIVPKLEKVLAEDELAYSGDAALNTALFLYLDYLSRAHNHDAAASLRAREVERWQKIRDSENVEAKRLATTRLATLDAIVFNVSAFAQSGKQDSKESTEAFAEFEKVIAEELKSDPFLIFIANQYYVALLQNDAEDKASEFRKKILKEFDANAWTNVMGSLDPNGLTSFSLESLQLLKESTFDESIFDIPNNETVEFYLERRDVLTKLVEPGRSKNFYSMPITKAKFNELNAKAAIALCNISIQLRKRNRELNVAPLADFVKAQNAVLSSETAACFRKAIDDERTSEKPNEQFIDAVRAALLSFELDEAIRSGDDDAISDVCERFLEIADANFFARNRFLRDAKFYAQKNRELANRLLDAFLDKANKSQGGLAVYVETVKELKKSLDVKQ